MPTTNRDPKDTGEKLYDLGRNLTGLARELVIPDANPRWPTMTTGQKVAEADVGGIIRIPALTAFVAIPLAADLAENLSTPRVLWWAMRARQRALAPRWRHPDHCLCGSRLPRPSRWHGPHDGAFHVRCSICRTVWIDTGDSLAPDAEPDADADPCCEPEDWDECATVSLWPRPGRP